MFARTSVNLKHLDAHSSGASPLLQWYYAHGLVIENITAFVRYEPITCFSKFTEEVAATRRKADVDQTGTAAGNMAKLIGKLNIF